MCDLVVFNFHHPPFGYKLGKSFLDHPPKLSLLKAYYSYDYFHSLLNWHNTDTYTFTYFTKETSFKFRNWRKECDFLRISMQFNCTNVTFQSFTQYFKLMVYFLSMYNINIFLDKQTWKRLDWKITIYDVDC